MGFWMELLCFFAFRRAKAPGYSDSNAQHPFTSDQIVLSNSFDKFERLIQKVLDYQQTP